MVMSDINQKLSETYSCLIQSPMMANPNDGLPLKKMKFSHVTRDELKNVSREEFIDRIMQQQQEIDMLKSKQTGDPGLDELMQTVEKLKQQVTDSAQQENKLVMRLAAKDHEMQELVTQIQEMKQVHNPSLNQLSSMLLDPAVNLMFYHMKQEMDLLKSKLEQAQNDLAAWKFTPDSQTGKRLMAKCRMLLQENEELGKNVSTGRVAKLEGDIALQRTLIMEMKKSEAATEEFMTEIEDDTEAMQGTVYLLQQELKDAKERLRKYECNDNQSSCDMLTDKTTCNDDRRTKTDLDHMVWDHSKLNAAVMDAVKLHPEDVAMAADSFNEAEAEGRLTVNRIDIVVDEKGQLDADSTGNDTRVGNDSSLLVRNHNSGSRTSPHVGFAAAADETLAASIFSTEVSSRSDLSGDLSDPNKHRVIVEFRTAAHKADTLLDTKVNGLNVLVPMADDLNN